MGTCCKPKIEASTRARPSSVQRELVLASGRQFEEHKAINEGRETEEVAVYSLRKQKKTWEGFELFAQSEALGLAAAVCCAGNRSIAFHWSNSVH